MFVTKSKLRGKEKSWKNNPASTLRSWTELPPTATHTCPAFHTPGTDHNPLCEQGPWSCINTPGLELLYVLHNCKTILDFQVLNAYSWLFFLDIFIKTHGIYEKNKDLFCWGNRDKK